MSAERVPVFVGCVTLEAARVTSVISIGSWPIEMTFVTSRGLAPDSYPAAVDVRNA